MINVNSFSVRHALSVGMAVLAAVFCSYYFSFGNPPWIIFAAFLVSQTTQGTPFRQAGIFFLHLIVAVLLSAFLITTVKTSIVLYGLLGLAFVMVGCFIFINRPQTNKAFYLSVFFFLVFLIAMLTPLATPALIHDNLMDVVIGALISILCTQILARTRIEKAFSQSMQVLLPMLSEYAQAVIDNFSQPHFAYLLEKKSALEALQVQPGLYPEWVYEAGFNPGLRAGLRFFLINLERVMEIFFSMNYLLLRQLHSSSLQELVQPLSLSMQKNQELIMMLTDYFLHKKIKEFHSDFTSDITDLENALHNVVPNNLELLDISPDYITLTALVKDIKDLRELLLQLIAALPSLVIARADA